MTKVSRVDFAASAGVDSSILSSVEHARAPLRLWVAKKLLDCYRLNPSWLAAGIGRPMASVTLPALRRSLGPPDQLFSAVYDSTLREEAERALAAYEADPRTRFGEMTLPETMEGRVEALEWLSFRAQDWFEAVPSSKMNELLNKLIWCGDEFMQAFPGPGQGVTDSRRDQMASIRDRIAARRVMLNQHQRVSTKKKGA